MTHDIPGKARSTSRKATPKNPVPAVQVGQPRSQKGRAVTSSPHNGKDGALVPKRKKPFVL
jgi:hypothetical protein